MFEKKIFDIQTIRTSSNQAKHQYLQTLLNAFMLSKELLICSFI